MSYILEALRKSEQQRHLGQVPTLATSEPVIVPPKDYRLHKIIAGLLVLNTLAIGYYWYVNKTAAPGATPVEQRAANTVPEAPPVSPAPATQQQEPAADQPTLATTAVPPPVQSAPTPQSISKEESLDDIFGQASPPVAAGRTETSSRLTTTRPLLEPKITRTVATPPPFSTPGDGKRAPHRGQENTAPARVRNQGTPNNSVAKLDRLKSRIDTMPPATREPLVIENTPPEFTLPPEPKRPVQSHTGPSGAPDVNINVHFYAEKVSDRFAIINMRKYRTGETIGDGMVIQDIVRDGVVVNQNGKRLFVPRRR